jgi:hypothetical protein
MMMWSSREVVFVLAAFCSYISLAVVGWKPLLRVKQHQNGLAMMTANRYVDLLDRGTQTDLQQQQVQQQQQQPQQQQQQQEQQEQQEAPPQLDGNERTRLEFVPVVNTANMEISVSNPFGPPVLSLTECQKELLSLLRQETTLENESFYHCRVEYLTKVLEQSYIPAQTLPFLQLILAGEWEQMYSNVLTPRADETLEVDMYQEIIPSPDGSTGGELRNRIGWQLHRPDDTSRGDLVVQCGYQINTKGEMDVSLTEHFLLPVGEMPKDPEGLVMSMQRSVPFEVFDPDLVLIKNTYITPDLRICRISGDKFYNVFNVFVKCPPGPTDPAAATDPAVGTATATMSPRRRGTV